MSRKIKNVVMIATIIIVCILSYFTMNGAAKNTMPDNSFDSELGGKIPNFNNGEISEEDMSQRPAGSFNRGEMPSLENLPENFEKGETPNLENLPENLEEGEMPSLENLPEDFENREIPSIENLQENFKESFQNGKFSNKEFKASISTIYYILFAAEALIISSLLIYLIMSKFNSKTLKETLSSGKNIIIFTILTIVITLGLTVVQSVLVKNVFVTNNMTQFENIRRYNNNDNSNITNETTENNDETNQI